LLAFVGILKQEEQSEFIVAVIKGNTNLTPKKKAVDSDSPEPTQDSEVPEAPEEAPVVREEL